MVFSMALFYFLGVALGVAVFPGKQMRGEMYD
jgi:hypothetical protein